MWWSWTRRARPIELHEGQRWPDGDTVVPDGRARWADLLRPGPAEQPTQYLPVVRPLMTPAGWWRSGGSEPRR